ncbi:MAG: alpha/beta hydrolase [Deltaproteobacteria bacterium]|nr:alpha/beta hydrolase [Deltaproteobacteria bacterium]
MTTYTPECGSKGHILFVHGGPGSHSAYFEAALTTFPAYHERMPYGWVCYDQRGCGRSGPSASVSHQGNIDDLAALVRTLGATDDTAPIALLGHSYGSWLLYDTLRQHPELVRKAVFVGRALDQRLSRVRSLLMDLLLLKLDQPDDYAQIRPTVGTETNPFLAAHREIIARMRFREKRNRFYWGNLEAMQWYEGVKQQSAVKENDTVMRAVADSLYQMTGPLGEFDFRALPTSVLLVNGFHDFLMGGETPPISAGVPYAILPGSGHYPHFEEPDRFVDLLVKFLEEQP